MTDDKKGRYRKVEVRTWGDEKFRTLTPIPPCGQGLWLFLITGPHTGPIPGLFRAGRAAMAEELGWDLEAFDQAFGEAFGQGMVKADFMARVIWIPNAIRHNRPESPNVVRSWASEFDLVPECDLKREAYESLRASIHALGEAFAKAFDEAFTKPSPKPSTKPYPKAMANQEQEQEQHQEQEQKEKTSLRSVSSTDVDPPKLELASPDDLTVRKTERLRQVTDEAITAYNAILAKPNGLLAAVHPTVGREKRRDQVKRCLRVAKQICEDQFNSPTITAELWEMYFRAVADDPFRSGREKPTGAHRNWEPGFEYLTREDVMLDVFTKATGVAA